MLDAEKTALARTLHKEGTTTAVIWATGSPAAKSCGKPGMGAQPLGFLMRRPLILPRRQTGTIDPFEKRHRLDDVRRMREVLKRDAKRILDPPKGWECSISNVVISNEVPEQLDGVEFRASRREPLQVQSRWHDEVFGDMVPGTIEDDDTEVAREFVADVREKRGHHGCVQGAREHGADRSVEWADGGQSMDEFAYLLARRNRPPRCRRPASAHVGNSTESRFVLEQQAWPQSTARLFHRGADAVWEVFLYSSWTAGSASGWRGRGASLRQSWR